MYTEEMIGPPPRSPVNPLAPSRASGDFVRREFARLRKPFCKNLNPIIWRVVRNLVSIAPGKYRRCRVVIIRIISKFKTPVSGRQSVFARNRHLETAMRCRKSKSEFRRFPRIQGGHFPALSTGAAAESPIGGPFSEIIFAILPTASHASLPSEAPRCISRNRIVARTKSYKEM